MRYAEEANYWATTIHPAKSKGEIEELLDDFGATDQMSAKGRIEGKLGWMIRFVWNNHSYRFFFTPLECATSEKISSFGGKKRTHQEQAEYQMGRIAVHFVKAILTAAEAQPEALFGFMELPATTSDNGMPKVMAEMDISNIGPSLPFPVLSDGRT